MRLTFWLRRLWSAAVHQGQIRRNARRRRSWRCEMDPLEDRNAPAIYRVNWLASDPTPDGSTWFEAYPDLQSAITRADAGDEIWVARGTYKPTAGLDRTAAFVLESGVGIYGGFAGTETARDERNWTTNVTILSGDIGVAGNALDNSYNIVRGIDVGTPTLDGFTITAGQGDEPTLDNPYHAGSIVLATNTSGTLANLIVTNNYARYGAGISLWDNANPSVTNVVIRQNTAGVEGGGMHANFTSSPTLTDVTFEENHAAGNGGGLLNFGGSPTLNNVTFSRNSANYGGGMINGSGSPSLHNVTFSGNTASVHGGGIYNDNSSPTLSRVTFTGNSARYYGGGIANFNFSSPNVTNAIFSRNTAEIGGGVYDWQSSPSLTNVLFIKNSASYGGGGIYNYNYSSPKLIQVTMADNSALADGGGAIHSHWYCTPVITNSVLWGNTDSSGAGQIYERGYCSLVVTNSIIQGGYAGATDADPRFAQSGTDNYRLLAESPAIDTGTATGAPSTDLDGLPRPVDGNLTGGAQYDMGAYEFQPYDFGDAPDSYHTTLAANGPQHLITGLYLGAVVDGELDGQPTADARGDDLAGVDDEDGVLVSNLVAGNTATWTVNVTGGPAKLDAWIDWNRDGVFDPSSERITAVGGTAVVSGTNLLTVAVPVIVSPGATYARFRLSTAGGLNPTGPAADGEVEDYRLTVYSASRILFDSDRDGNGEIYVMNADGTGQNRLTHTSGSDMSPAWSPDGTRVAFTSMRDGNLEIYVMNADGTGQTNLSNNSAVDIYPAWSPDGSKIAFRSARDAGNWEIYVINADGTGLTRLTNTTASEDQPDWSPDGSKIAFSKKATFGNPWDIYVMNADGSSEIRLTTGVNAIGAAWSPDGSKIAFGQEGSYDIYVMNADGTGQLNLTGSSGTWDDHPTWSPDGSRIAFRRRVGDSEIFVMNADGTNPVNLTQVPVKDDSYPAWGGIFDATPPTTTATRSAEPNPNGWNNTNVTITLNATDLGGSGVQAICYSINGLPTQTSTSVPVDIPLTSEGDFIVQYWSIDNAGNAETPRSLTVRIDKSAPTAVPGGPYVTMLNHAVAFDGSSSSDHIDTYAWLVSSAIPLAGATPTLSAAQVNSLGLGTFGVSLTVVDLAGNPGTASTTVSVRETPSLVVTTLTDAVSDFDGLTSLREAIAYANSLPGDDTITFTAGLDGAINLSTSEGGRGTLNLPSNVTIDGAGASIILEGGSAKGATTNAQVLSIPDAVAVNLKNLVIRHGYTTGFGAGIWNQGTLTVTDCTFIGNLAGGYGGAIGNRYGSVTVIGSTFTDNGGVGALFNWEPSVGMNLTNSTLADNPGGAIVSYYAPLRVTNSTIVRNAGGGISSDGTDIVLVNSLLVQNGGYDYFGDAVGGGSVHNLIQVDHGSGLTNGVNGNIIGAGVTFVGLTPLGNYSGPTQTIALLPGSQAIHAGTSGVGIPTSDQRGVSRVGATDIGAFESRGFSIAVTSGNNQSTPISTAFAAPLVATVSSAFGEPVVGGTVTFTPPATDASAVLSGSPATIAIDGTASVTATANGVIGANYTVTASVNGATSAAFTLSNQEAPSLVVTTLTDVADDYDGLTSLREAITYANSNPGDDTITFTVSGTILLGSALPNLSTNIDIQGGGTITVDGANAFRVFYISGTTVSLTGLTITHGSADAGGGIYNSSSSPTLTNVTLSGNSASWDGGGIYNSSSSPTLTNVTLSGNSAVYGGGGIYNLYSSPTLTNVTLSGNSATYGGGIYNEYSSPTLSTVTLSGNSSEYGGGIYSNSSSPTLINVTLAGNSAIFFGGGIYNWNSSPTLTNVTLSGNSSEYGGGIYNSCYSSPTLTQAILWGNTASAAGPQIYDDYDSASTVTNSVVQGGWTGIGNIDADPLLAPLGDNGGATQTFALLPGSSAINAGTSTGAPLTDQRGITRDANPDIGAFESQGFSIAVTSGNNQSTPISTAFAAPLVATVTSAFGEPVVGGLVTFTPPATGASAVLTGSPATIASDGTASVTASANGVIGANYPVTANANGATSADFTLSNRESPSLVVTTLTDVADDYDALTSLREAIAYANSNPGDDTITFAVSGTILLGSELPYLGTNIAIQGGGNITVDGANAFRVFYVSNATVSLTGLTISHGWAEDGGGIYNQSGTLTLTNVTLSGNTATYSGGGILNFDSSPTLTNVTLSGNKASDGGGILNVNGSPTLTNVTLSGNSTLHNGGGIYNVSSSPTLTNSILWGNTAAGAGAQIYDDVASTSTVTSSVVQGGWSGGNIDADPLLAPLGDYGGGTQTFALLPGSSAINAGTSGSGIPTTDQRGVSRVGVPDIGAFESQGFSIAVTSGNNQFARTGTAFAQPLTVTVSSAFSEPVAGGQVLFTPPASGASAAMTGSPATLAGDGTASATATANATSGQYTVTASAAGASPVDFTLNNDGIAPTTTATPSVAPNGFGWNKEDVTVTLTPDDGTGAGIQATYYIVGGSSTQSGTSIPLTAEGVYLIQYWSVDKVGNVEATQTLTVSIDKSAPTISGAVDRPANPNGWYNADVTVTFSGDAGISGIDTLTAPVTLGEGAGQSAIGTIVDRAGNSASITVSDINIDMTPPTISATILDGMMGDNGWYVTDVTVRFNCDDSLSGLVSTPPDEVLSSEGAAVSSTAQIVTDLAGNVSAPSDIITVRIDKSMPSVPKFSVFPADPTNRTTASFTFDATDAISGVSYFLYWLDSDGAQPAAASGGSATVNLSGLTEGTHTFYVAAVDEAGNVDFIDGVAAYTWTIDRQTTLVVAPATGTYGGTTTLAATLTWHGDGSPLLGQTVAFTINGVFAGSAVTDGSGVAKLVGASLAGIGAGTYPTYVVADFAGVAGDDGYDAASGAGSLWVGQKELTVSGIAGVNKVYDGDAIAPLDATAATLIGVVAGDTVNLDTSGGVGVFADRNVGAGKLVTISGLNLTGASAGNYALTQPTATASITLRTLVITAVANTKTYDGNTSAAATPTVTGLQGSDTVTGHTEAYLDRNAGSNKELTVTAYTVNDGNGGGNYSVSLVNSNEGVINKAALTISAVANTKIFDNTTRAANLPVVLGLVGGDTATGLAQVYDNKNVGAGKRLMVSAYTLNDGNGGANYAVTLVANYSGVIQPATMTFLTQPPLSIWTRVILPPIRVRVGIAGVPVTIRLNAGILRGTVTRYSNAAGIVTFNNLYVETPGTFALIVSSPGFYNRWSRAFRVVANPWLGRRLN